MPLLIILALLTPALLQAQLEPGFVSLMPKNDVQELWTIEGTPPETWSVKDGVIACTGKPNGFLRSKKTYKNYVLRAEWRFEAEGWTGAPEKWPNAGFFIHAHEVKDAWPRSHEVQGHFGQAGSLFGVRGGTIKGARRGPLVKNRIRFGDWDRYEITSQNGSVRVVLNGELVNEGVEADPSEGHICIQSEGWPLFYRNIAIKVLPD
ncbi:MAG: DUF1080 domain-containing protein [Acidobacteriota bacterium]